MGSCNEPPRFFCFFLFYHYSCATYLDHDEGTIRFLAADRARRHSASSPCALRPALPESEKRKEQRKTHPLLLSRQCHEGGGGEEEWMLLLVDSQRPRQRAAPRRLRTGN